MTISYPVSLAFLSDTLRPRSLRVGIARQDVFNSLGTGSRWSQEIIKPYWMVDMTFAPLVRDLAKMRALDAKIRVLGYNNPMLFADPAYKGPASDPLSVAIASSSITLHTIAAQRDAIRITGLPASFVINAGDRFSIAWGSGRYYYGEFSEGGTAVAGLTGILSIFPALPAGIVTTTAVEMRNPVMKMVVTKDGHTPFELTPGFIADSSSLKLEQRTT